MNLKLELLVQAEEPDVTIAAKDRGNGEVTARFEPLLKLLVDAGRMGRIRPLAGMGMEVAQQPVAELLKLDQQPVSYPRIRDHAGYRARLVLELRHLVEHEHTVDLRSGDEHEVLALVPGELLEALVEEERANAKTRLRCLLISLVFSLNAVQAVDEPIDQPDFVARFVHSL